MLKYIPNTLTSLNLVCGLLSILFVMMGDVVTASYLIFIGAFFDFTDGFGLVRPSNTSPAIILRFEGNNSDALERIKDRFKEQLLAVDKNLKLPF